MVSLRTVHTAIFPAIKNGVVTGVFKGTKDIL
jgi:hypothetical protein